MQHQLSLEGDERFQANQNLFDSGRSASRLQSFTPHSPNTTYIESRLSGAVSPPFELDVQGPWREQQTGSTENTPGVSVHVFHDFGPFQASPWFEGENNGFGPVPTPGSTANLFLGEFCLDSLDTQAELKSPCQDFSFGNPPPSNHWNSSGNLESQPWAVSTRETRKSVPSHAITHPLTFTNNPMDIGFDTNSYAQGLNYSAPDSDLNLQVSDVPAIGPHSLDFFSMDVGQASFETLMPAFDNSQELVFGSGRTFSDPTVQQDLLQNNSVSSLPNASTFDDAGFHHAQGPQGQTQASQDEGHFLPGPTTFPNHPNPVQQLTATASTFACAHGNCNQAFRRKSDLARHRKTVHGVNLVKFFCHIPGCAKGRGHGEGYSRDDKLTEHLWKKHGNLGYTKSR